MSRLGPTSTRKPPQYCGSSSIPPEGTLGRSRSTKRPASGPEAPTQQNAPDTTTEAARRRHQYMHNGTRNLSPCLHLHSGRVSTMPPRRADPLRPARLPGPARSRGPRPPQSITITDNLSSPHHREVRAVARRPLPLAVRLHARARGLAQPGSRLFLPSSPPPLERRRLSPAGTTSPNRCRLRRDPHPTGTTSLNWTYSGKVLPPA